MKKFSEEMKKPPYGLWGASPFTHLVEKILQKIEMTYMEKVLDKDLQEKKKTQFSDEFLQKMKQKEAKKLNKKNAKHPPI